MSSAYVKRSRFCWRCFQAGEYLSENWLSQMSFLEDQLAGCAIESTPGRETIVQSVTESCDGESGAIVYRILILHCGRFWCAESLVNRVSARAVGTLARPLYQLLDGCSVDDGDAWRKVDMRETMRAPVSPETSSKQTLSQHTNYPILGLAVIVLPLSYSSSRHVSTFRWEQHWNNCV